MNWKRIAVTSGTLLLAGTGAALAATSGLPMDGPINNTVHFISTDVAYSGVAVGFAGTAYHLVSGRETHTGLNYALGAIAGGALCSQIAPAAAAIGLAAGALIKLVA